MGRLKLFWIKKTLFQPDFIYVSAERIDIVRDYIYGAPDIVVEVLRGKNAYYDLRPKKDTYEKYGVKEYIIVDPIEESAEVHSLVDGIYVLKQKAQKSEILQSVILPELRFDLGTIFR